jgi:hypothetical protein
MGDVWNTVTDVLSGGATLAARTVFPDEGSQKVINSFGSFGLSDLGIGEGNGFNPLDLGKAGFQWTDDRTGMGSFNQDLGNIINTAALIYGGYSAASGLGALFGTGAGGSAAAVPAAGAGEAAIPVASGGAAAAESLIPLETAAAIDAGTGAAAAGAGEAAIPSLYSSMLPAAESYVMGGAAPSAEALLAASNAASAVPAAAGGGGILSSIGSGLGSISSALGGYKVPLALLAANLGSQYISSKSQQEASEAATENNREWWQTNAYPNSAAVSAQSSEAYSNLASQLAEAKRKMTEDAAKRGLKGGSLSGAYSNLNTAAQKNYASLANDLIQYANTPMFSPTGTSMTPTPTAASGIANTISGLTGTLGGLYAYKNYNNLFG